MSPNLQRSQSSLTHGAEISHSHTYNVIIYILMSTFGPEFSRPLHRRGRLRTAAIFLGLALLPTVVAPATVIAVVDPGWYADAAHALFGEQSPTERKISNALQAALGMSVSIRCAPTWAETDEVVTQGTASSVLGLDTIRLQEDGVCNELGGDINAILSGAKFGADTDRKLAIVDAIMVATHEGAHVQYGADTESVTECQAYQNAPAVARALGATDSSMEEVLYMLPFSHNGLTDKYMTTEDCADGGLYDLHPDQVGGTFPQPGRLG